MALVVVTGGVRSGKSGLAQALAVERADLGQPVVVAVFGRPIDTEMAERIERHRESRPASLVTFEVVSAGEGWLGQVDEDAALLVDCLGTLLGLIIDDALGTVVQDAPQDGEASDVIAGEVATRVESGLAEVVDALLARRGDTIVVTNEVGDGVVPASPAGRLFRDALGRANRRLVDGADAAYLVVAGRAIDLDALPRELHWPHD